MRRLLLYPGVLLTGVILFAGCQRPTLMPITPVSTTFPAENVVQKNYDTNNDDRIDYLEQYSAQERVKLIRIDTDLDGSLDLEVVLDQIAISDCRQLLIILDSIPYCMVKEMWDLGRLRLFHSPSWIIPPFPAMTDLSIDEFFGTSPCKGIESHYFDGKRKTNRYLTYFAGGNAPWMSQIDYMIHPLYQSAVYLWPDNGFKRELAAIEKVFFDHNNLPVVAYSVATSAGGSKFGRDGHQRYLIAIDRFCQALMQRCQGKIQITLMSDHGHNLMDSEYFPFHDRVRALGYNDGETLQRGGDVVITRFGPVTCSGLYTHEPARVAADVVGLKEVELSSYKNRDEIIILSKTGRGHIRKSNKGYRYKCDFGDPLKLLPTIQQLSQKNQVDANGFVDDQVLFDATCQHLYPDAIPRLWRAFNGLMEYPPDVLVSFHEGYCFGASFFNNFITMKAVHGNLRPLSSSGFVLTTAGVLPGIVRMENLAKELEKLGLVPLYTAPTE